VEELTDLPSKNFLRISEAATYFGVHERTVRLWIEHGLLVAERPRGSIFIPRESIRLFRLKSRIMGEDSI
jgi:excisionase family DNA binding protein